LSFRASSIQGPTTTTAGDAENYPLGFAGPRHPFKGISETDFRLGGRQQGTV